MEIMGRVEVRVLWAENRARHIIREVEVYQDKKDEELIAQRMKWRTGWPWARRNYTREEAIRSYTEAIFSPFPCIDGWQCKDEAQAILRLCQAAEREGNRTIWLTDAALATLDTWGASKIDEEETTDRADD